MDYQLPETTRPPRIKKKQVLLVASGDLRPAANRNCWASQQDMEEKLRHAVAAAGYEMVRAHPYRPDQGHGFISSQKEGMQVFAGIDAKAPLIVAEAVWQYSHHVLHGLISHRGPILTVANWSGTWPGLVGMLNLNGSLTKADVRYSTLWSEDFIDEFFQRGLRRWLRKGDVRHKCDHVVDWDDVRAAAAERRLGEALARKLQRDKAIMGVFDEGCMGMFNAIIPDHLLARHRRLQGAAQPVGALLRNNSGFRRRGCRRAALDGRTGHEVRHRLATGGRADRRSDSQAVQNVHRGRANCR